MKTWDDWSDFEINKAVVCALGLKILSIWTVNPNVFITLGSSEASKKVDYCNNPADMWPIILENGISLINDKGFYYATSNCYETFEPHGLGVADGYFYSKAKDKSGLLRAAAIVFLMMNGVKPE